MGLCAGASHIPLTHENLRFIWVNHSKTLRNGGNYDSSGMLQGSKWKL